MKKTYEQGVKDGINKLATELCKAYAEYESRGWDTQKCVDIRNMIAGIAEQIKDEQAR